MPTLNLLSNFNPRSREGSDAILSRDPRNAEISIHAPARGATMQAQKRAILQRISIHAPARGATRSLFRIAKAGSYFNPRSREGSDHTENHSHTTVHISIHAPARGATAVPCRQSRINTISIHAPARGATPFGRIFCLFAAISIHAPARGATSVDRFLSPIWKFQSTLPRGERLLIFPWTFYDHDFNPRSREGSDVSIRHLCR